MPKDTSKVHICDYEPKYAKSLAEMWNSSTEAWNGHLFNYSETQILDEEADSTAITRYLAIDEDRVVGYINLYQDEADIANVGMLNVLPSYHGSGLGKILLKRCILKAAELNIPYITLYTWAGNTKAVPLYKKCGFFWQKMEASATYLVNFIPGLLNNALLKPYFEYFDWYNDLVRDLRVEPDGDEEGDFILYRYLWQKEGSSLKVVFDKASRSIVEIESEDFHLCTKVAVAKPVFGTSHKVRYAYQSYSPGFEKLQIKSLAEHNIAFDFTYQGSSSETQDVVAEYQLLPITKSFSEWDAMPAVKSEVRIGDKAIIVGNSQIVSYPIQLTLTSARMLRTDCAQVLFLNLQSNLDEVCNLKLSFPQEDKVKLPKSQITCTLGAKEKKVLQLDMILSSSTFYTPRVQADFTTKDNPHTQFELEPEILLRTLRGTDAKRNKDKAYLVVGMTFFQMPLNDQKNWGYLLNDSNACTYIRPSDIGRPFTAEFDNEDPVDIVFESKADSAGMEVFYESKKHPGLRFSKIFTLFSSGEMQQVLRFQNIPKEHETLCLRELVGAPTAGFTFAKGERLISLAPQMNDECLSDFDVNLLSEPWIYFSKDRHSTAIAWENGWKVSFDRWWISFVLDLAWIKSQKDMQSPAMRYYLDCFVSAYQLRDYVLGRFTQKIPMQYSADLIANRHNPFYEKSVELNIVHHQQMGIQGTLQLPELDFAAPAEPDKALCIDLPGEPVTLLDAQIAYPAFEIRHPRVLLRKSGNLSYIEDEHYLGVDNAQIRFYAKKGNALPTVSSLIHKDLEWLDPIPQGFVPRSSFNPYPGGILCAPSSVKAVNFMRDRHILQKAELADQHGNLWLGLSWESKIEHFEPLSGLRYRQYYLTCPGVPILILAVEILHSLDKAGFLNFGFQSHFHPQNVMPKAIFSYPDTNSKWYSYRCTQLMQHHSAQSSIYRLKVDATVLHTLSFSNRYWTLSSNKDFMRTVDHCYSTLLPKPGDILLPIIMLFDTRDLEPDMMQDLLNLKLKPIH